MSATLDELDAWLAEPEAERLEFKEAKSNFHFETLAKYCAALANEGGGKIIFGVTDKRPSAGCRLHRVRGAGQNGCRPDQPAWNPNHVRGDSPCQWPCPGVSCSAQAGRRANPI